MKVKKERNQAKEARKLGQTDKKKQSKALAGFSGVSDLFFSFIKDIKTMILKI